MHWEETHGEHVLSCLGKEASLPSRPTIGPTAFRLGLGRWLALPLSLPFSAAVNALVKPAEENTFY